MTKKALFVFLSLVMASMLVMTGCTTTEEPATEPEVTTEPAAATEPVATTEPAATPETTSITEPATTAETTATEEVLEFRFATHTPEDMTAYWADRVEEDTGGRVKIVVYPNNSLLDMQDTLIGLKDGITDIAFVAPESFPEAHPLNNVLLLPFLPLGAKEQQYQLWHDLQAGFPELEAEWDGFQVLFDDTMLANTLHMANFTAKTPEDMEGLRMFSGGTIADIMEDNGATPLYLEVPDWFTSLDRGLLDGMWLPWDAVYEINIYPLLHYHTTFPSAPGMLMRNVLVREDAWNTIPPDCQEAILAISPDQRQQYWDTLDEKVAAVRAAVLEGDGEIVDLTPEEVNIWYEAAKPFHEAYLAEVDAMGLPGTELYNRAIELAQEYAK